MAGKKKAKKTAKKKASATARAGASRPNLRLLTQNAKMLPGLLGDGDDDLARAGTLAEAILASGYDVVCLQEIFDEDVRELLSQRLISQLPHQRTLAEGRSIFKQDSGLFLASKYEIKGWNFVKFDACSGTDCWAEKGVLAASLAVQDFTLVVYNVHLQADYDWVGESEAERGQQLQQIRGLVRNSLMRTRALAKTGAIVMGDMNVDGGSPEYQQAWRILEHPVDLFREKSDAHGYTWDGSQNDLIPDSDFDKLRLDYIFAMRQIPVGEDGEAHRLNQLECQSCEVQTFQTTRSTRLSDHFGVETQIAFT